MPVIKRDPAGKKRVILDEISRGAKVADACRAAGCSRQSYELYLANDPEFKASVQHVRAVRARKLAGESGEPIGEFSEFCARYLGSPVFWHQQQWVDVLEGREPRDLHPAQTYLPARRELLVLNVPPEHAKSTTITTNYVTYRICKDPNVRIIIVSKTKEMAKKFVYAIKNRLTHPRYRELQAAFAPVDGFAQSADAWTSDMIYLGGDQRDSGEKDPTLLALGIGGQIYGARADLIIIDDAVTLSNAHEFEKQLDWLGQEVVTRLADDGKLLVVGTRVAATDLYSELISDERYPDGTPWTYFAAPAVLEGGEDPETWRTLWPETEVNGERQAKWPGPALARRRAVVSPRTWAMAYQQQALVEDAIFSPEKVRAAVNGQRNVGPLIKGAVGHPPNGPDGMVVVAGLDPAMVGFTAAVAMAVDRPNRKRYVLDVHNQAGMTPDGIRELIRSWTTRLGIIEWRIEKNAFQQMLTQDTQVREFLASRGAVLREHHTGGYNKWNADFGVAAMAGLFDAGLIDLPSTKKSEATKQLIEQLVTWYPETKGKTDTVMALWFAEIRAREICDFNGGRSHLENRYLSEVGRKARTVINLDDYWAERQATLDRLTPIKG